MYQQPPSVGRHVLYQVILFCTSLVVLYPILWVVKIALTPSQAFSMDPWPFPSEVSFENFEAVVSNPSHGSRSSALLLQPMLSQTHGSDSHS